MKATAVQPLLFPLAGLAPMSVERANELLVLWGHKLGPVHRPFRQEAYALEVDGRPLSVAVSAAQRTGTQGGRHRDTEVIWHRQEVVELARLCSDPENAWATRVMLRLWREVCAQLWKCWPVRAAVSYSHNALHAGTMYRMDGWRRINDNCGSSGGGTYSRPRYATDAVHGRKTLWDWSYEEKAS